MDAIKKLVVVGRRNRTSSVVSDDDDNDFCYRRHDSGVFSEGMGGTGVGDASAAGNYGKSGGRSSRLSLYGRRCSARDLMSVETSNKFDSDVSFSMIARKMLYCYENENMNEREVIRATLTKAEDKRAFIEALDLKYSTLLTANTDSSSGEYDADEAMSEVIHQIRSIFDATLKAMWREQEESSSSSSSTTKTEREATFKDVEAMAEQDRSNEDHQEYRRHHRPKTPKNLRMSPMQTSFKYKSYGHIARTESCESTSSVGSSSSNIFQPFKRRRRWFFAENKKRKNTERSVTPPSPSLQYNRFPIKDVIPKLHFDFGGSNSSLKNNQVMFGGFNIDPRPVQSLRLDGSSASLSYMPPTSPIRKVSEEMNVKMLN
eukprot:jgi/Psemu1/237830/estExt_Genewise1.C_790032